MWDWVVAFVAAACLTALAAWTAFIAVSFFLGV